MQAADRSLSLLVVEDNEADARLLRESLREVSGVQVSICQVETLGGALWQISMGAVFDAALVDLDLPDSSGLQTLERIAARAPDLPILALSGRPTDGTSAAAGANGVGDWLPKGQLPGEAMVRAIRYAIDRKGVDKELSRARAAADESARLKAAILMNMNHEVRTPLNIIGGFVELIAVRAEESGDREQLEYAERAKRGCARLLSTMQGLLDLSRLQADIQRSNPVPVDLGALILQEVEHFRPEAEERELKLEAILEESPIIYSDSYMMSRALQNLIDNAIKFTARGSVTVRLRRDELRQLRLEVSDTGIGIHEELAPRLFKPFSQIEDGNTRLFEGAGVGLAVAKQFLELNGASIDFSSRPCEGSTFVISFEAGREVAPKVPEGRPIALVAEEDPVARRHLSTLFSGRYEVLAAGSHGEFFERLDEAGSRLRLVLLNPSLGGQGEGLRLGEAVGAQERWRHVPVIQISNA